jgi:hypothetical protein
VLRGVCEVSEGRRCANLVLMMMMMESFLDRQRTSLDICSRSVSFVTAHELGHDIHSHEASRLGSCGSCFTVQLLKQTCCDSPILVSTYLQALLLS